MELLATVTPLVPFDPEAGPTPDTLVAMAITCTESESLVTASVGRLRDVTEVMEATSEAMVKAGLDKPTGGVIAICAWPADADVVPPLA